MPNQTGLQAREERNGWPSFQRPDHPCPAGWSHALVTSVSRPRSHALSPDGSRIAFFWDREDASDLYVMDSAGGWPARLTADREPLPYWFDDPPQWSPDGAWLAYTSQGHVWVVPVAGGLPRKVSGFTGGAGTPRWMPDSRGLLVTIDQDGLSRILLADRDGSWPRPVSPLIGRDHSPQASPNGRFVVYAHQPLDDLARTDIVLGDLESGGIRALTDTPDRVNRSPCWSPDGSRIAYTSESPGFFEVYLFDLESGRERQITIADHDLDGLAWSPDGTRLLCTVNRGGAFDLGIVDLRSGELQVVRREYGFHARPAWLPGNSITFEYEDPRRPPDIYRMDLDTRQISQLTFSMPPALAALDLAVPEQVSVSSFDGLEIPSFLYNPARPNGAAIVYPHGGPTAQYTLEWDIWAQYMVAKGYTVLAPNYRGSSGYGMDFERLNYDVWGVDDTQDCLAAADYLVETRGMDPKRIAICGASYGSYLVVCSLAFDPLHRFACGVAKYGDCNLLTSWAACDRSGQEDLYRMMGHPSTHRAGYKAGSPVWQVENIHAPLLVLHGLLDPYVPPMQSEELVEALRRTGKTYEYKTYPDEGHGFMRRKNQLDFYERMERFIDWYLL